MQYVYVVCVYNSVAKNAPSKSLDSFLVDFNSSPIFPSAVIRGEVSNNGRRR
jgi:hypothetical protein